MTNRLYQLERENDLNSAYAFTFHLSIQSKSPLLGVFASSAVLKRLQELPDDVGTGSQDFKSELLPDLDGAPVFPPLEPKQQRDGRLGA